MKKFDFRLEKVMEFKQHKQKENERKLAAVKQAINQQQNKLSEMNSQRDKCQQAMAEKNGPYLDVPEIQTYYLYLVRLTREIIQRMEQIWRLEEDAETKREILLKSAQEKKVLERLREKHYLSYRRELDKSEQKQLDEIASLARNNTIESLGHEDTKHFLSA